MAQGGFGGVVLLIDKALTLSPAVNPSGVAWLYTTAVAGTLEDDAADGVLAAERRWARVLDVLSAGTTLPQVALMRQVHGAEVARVDGGLGIHRHVGAIDALVTTEPGVALAVRVADCAPVLFASPRGVAAAHAGWRGAAGGVACRTLGALCEAADCAPADVIASVGPCLSMDAFEVGPEVVEALAVTVSSLLGLARRGRDDRWHVDLAGVVARQLREAGVGNVVVSGTCTTDSGWFSYRRDRGVTGRQAGLVMWLPTDR